MTNKPDAAVDAYRFDLPRESRRLEDRVFGP